MRYTEALKEIEIVPVDTERTDLHDRSTSILDHVMRLLDKPLDRRFVEDYIVGIASYCGIENRPELIRTAAVMLNRSNRLNELLLESQRHYILKAPPSAYIERLVAERFEERGLFFKAAPALEETVEALAPYCVVEEIVEIEYLIREPFIQLYNLRFAEASKVLH